MKILGVIPCYNESPHISDLLAELTQLYPEIDFLVVDDGSQDDSYQRALEHGKAIRLAANLGIGGAVQTGLRYAHQNSYDYALQIDGDGQHPASEVKKYLDEIKKSPCDILIGSRFLEKTGFQSSLSRRIGISMISGILKLLIGQSMTDPTSGFRLYSRKALALFQKNYPADYPEPISIVIAYRNGLSLREMSVTMKERQGGSSSIFGFHQFNYMFRVIMYLLIYRFMN